MIERDYWDQAAQDPAVDEKYICNLDDNDCLLALAAIDKVLAANAEAKVLDIGSGVGRITSLFSQTYPQANFYGIDLSTAMIRLARERSQATNIEYKRTDGNTIPYESNFFDAIYSMLTFQHIDDQHVMDYFYEAGRVLKSGGVFQFQYIAGSHHDFIDHGHERADVERWLDNAGITIKEISRGLVHPDWCWVTGVRL